MTQEGYGWQIIFGLYALATILQCGVWWGVLARIRNWEKTIPEQVPAQPIAPFSILICARNEAENLRRYLPAILAQQYDDQWELLVVDDASTDETPAVLHTFQERFPARMRVLRMAEKTAAGKKKALAQGIAAAQYDQLLCTDADCEPASPYWLAHMAATLMEKPETEIALGYGPMRATPDTGLNRRREGGRFNHWSRYETAFVAAQYFSFALAGLPYMGVGRNLAFKRKIFERVGAFAAHAHIPSGDDDLLVNAAANAQNTRICLAPESFVFSSAAADLRAWLRQKQRHLGASPAYRLVHKIALAGIGLSQVAHYFLWLLLCIAGIHWKLAAALFLLRILSVRYILGKWMGVLQEKGLSRYIPFYDPLLALYYGAVAPCLLMRKSHLSWR